MPLFHIGGGGWATAGMYVGMKSVILRELDPSALIRLIPEHGITHAFVVPAVLQFLLMVPGADRGRLLALCGRRLRRLPDQRGGAGHAASRMLGCKFWQAYGLTETTGAIVNLSPEDHDPTGPNRHRLRSCGKAGPGVELRIVEPESGADVPTGRGRGDLGARRRR